MMKITHYFDYYYTQSQFYNYSKINKFDKTFRIDSYISHAGGKYNDRYYTNSLQAIKNSHEFGFKFIEIDLKLTSDNHVVLFHENLETMQDVFPGLSSDFTLQVFNQVKIQEDLTLLTLSDLVEVIKQYPDIYFITDSKENNLKILKNIAQNYPEIKNKIIPQIYYFHEYFPVIDMGFNKIIFTTYKSVPPESLLIKFIEKYPITCLTVPAAHIIENQDSKLLQTKIPVYTHPVNNLELKNMLFDIGVTGIYTAELKPEEL